MLGTLCSCIVPESTHVKPTFHLLSKTTFDQNEQLVAAFAQIEDGNNTDMVFPSIFVKLKYPIIYRRIELFTDLRKERSNLGKTTVGESLLIEGIGRVVGLNLSQLLNSPFYSVYPIEKNWYEWEINITILRFERVSNNKILLEVSWEILI